MRDRIVSGLVGAVAAAAVMLAMGQGQPEATRPRLFDPTPPHLDYSLPPVGVSIPAGGAAALVDGLGQVWIVNADGDMHAAYERDAATERVFFTQPNMRACSASELASRQFNDVITRMPPDARPATDEQRKRLMDLRSQFAGLLRNDNTDLPSDPHLDHREALFYAPGSLNEYKFLFLTMQEAMSKKTGEHK